jgi:putative addiction module killer protein
MLEIIETDIFARWVEKLRDRRVQTIISDRLDRVREGNFGDTKSVGNGVHELRIHYGPGYRLYYFRIKAVVVVMLAGGTKSDQKRDIKKATQMAEKLTRG